MITKAKPLDQGTQNLLDKITSEQQKQNKKYGICINLTI